MSYWNAPKKDAMGMTDAEVRRTAEQMKQSNEQVMDWLKSSLRRKASNAKLDFDGSLANEMGVRIKATASNLPDWQFAELEAHAATLESDIAYPEVRICLLRRQSKQRKKEPRKAAAPTAPAPRVLQVSGIARRAAPRSPS